MKLNSKRLLKLADFLDKLPESKFDFGVEISSCKKSRSNPCGTVGCAIGWTPSVFPRLVRAVDKGWIGYVQHINTGTTGYMAVASELFGMTPHHAWKLFTPERPSPAGGKKLPGSATPKQVAKRIRTYVKWALKQEKAK